MKVIKITDILGREFFCEPNDEPKFNGTVAERREIEMSPEAYVSIPATSDAEQAFS